MYVITAEVKYSDDSDYVKSFLSYDEYADWGWVNENENESMTIIVFSTLEDAELIVTNKVNLANSYYTDVKNITIQRVELFDIS